MTLEQYIDRLYREWRPQAGKRMVARAFAAHVARQLLSRCTCPFHTTVTPTGTDANDIDTSGRGGDRYGSSE